MVDLASYIREPEIFSILYSLYTGPCPGQDIHLEFFFLLHFGVNWMLPCLANGCFHHIMLF